MISCLSVNISLDLNCVIIKIILFSFPAYTYRGFFLSFSIYYHIIFIISHEWALFSSFMDIFQFCDIFFLFGKISLTISRRTSPSLLVREIFGFNGKSLVSDPSSMFYSHDSSYYCERKRNKPNLYVYIST